MQTIGTTFNSWLRRVSRTWLNTDLCLLRFTTLWHLIQRWSHVDKFVLSLYGGQYFESEGSPRLLGRNMHYFSPGLPEKPTLLYCSAECVSRTTHSSATILQWFPLHCIASNVLKCDLSLPASHWHIYRYLARTPFSSVLKIFSSKSTLMTRRKQVLAKAWYLWVTVAVTFQVLIPYNTADRKLAQKNLNMMLMQVSAKTKQRMRI